MKIGVFDSGVGGLTVVKEIKNHIPWVPLVYFGDTARTPYGTKSPDTIERFALEDTAFLLSHGATLVVIACHSAASTASDAVKERFNVPVFEVVTPSVQEALRLTKKGRIGVIGTRATVSSRVYEKKIEPICPECTVLSQAAPLLVPLVEEGWFKARETRMIVKKYLRPLKLKGIDTLVLGCTHYPMLKDIISEKAGRSVKIVDPSKEVARRVARFIGEDRGKDWVTGDGSPFKDDIFYFSDLGPVTKEVIQRFLKASLRIEKAGPV